MAHDQEVVGSNPGTIYWMDVSNLLAITLKKNYINVKNLGSRVGGGKTVSKNCLFSPQNSKQSTNFNPKVTI
jgi:hypothetical protein